MIIARRLRSKPFVTRRGMASSLRLTSACTSTRKQRVPSTATWTAAPTDGSCSLRKSRDGSATPTRPEPVISKMPSSSVEPKRFLAARRVRKKRCRSPSNWSTVSTMCSRTRGPAIAPSLVTWPTRIDGGPGLLGEAEEDAGRLAHLAHAARRRGEGVAVEGLHRVDDDQRRAHGGHRLDDRLEARLGEHGDVVRRRADALGAHLDLRRRLLAADEQDGAAGRGDLVEHLQEQGALADAGLAADQHERAGDDAAAEHEVELGDAGGEALGRGRDDVGKADGGGAGGAAPVRLAPPAPTRRDLGDRLLDERVPGAAVRTVAEPLRLAASALGAGEDGLAARHDVRRWRRRSRRRAVLRSRPPARPARRRREPPVRRDPSSAARRCRRPARRSRSASCRRPRRRP